MLIEAVIAATSLLALSAAILALRIRRFTGRSPVPMLIAGALGGASVYHAIRLFTRTGEGDYSLPELAAELLVLLVFMAVNAGLLLMRPLFETARKATRAREESERRYRKMFENAHVGIYRTTPDGRVIMANPALVQMLGYASMKDLAGRDLEKEGFGPTYERSRFKELVERDGGVRGLEMAWTMKDGSLRYVRENASAIRNASGQVLYYEGIIEDVTARKNAESELRNSEERYRFLVELSPFGIAVHRSDKGLFANPAAARLFGEDSPDVFVGQAIINYVHPDYREAAIERTRRVTELHEPVELMETVYVRKGGEPFDVETVAAPITFQGKEAVLTVFHDITERKHAEDLEQQLQTSRKMEALGRLAGGVAHDFNNLLTAILGFSTLLLEQTGKDDPRRSGIEEITRAGKRAELLTSQLLAFSRRQVLEPTNLDLNRIVTGMEAMLHRLIGEDVVLTARLAPDLGMVKADQAQMEQVIVNLVVNARDAMPEGGKLRLETMNVDLDGTPTREPLEVESGMYVMLSVKDTGAGMDDEVQSHLFEPFFTTKEPGKGTGLGLSTVYGIVQQSGGTIRVHSRPESGTSFQVFLPRSQASRPRPRSVAPVALPILGTETILLAEDEGTVRGLARKVLEGLGYEVLEASNGLEALAVFEEDKARVDLLLTDVIMPEMNGRDLAERLRSERPDLPVLFISGYTDQETARSGIGVAGAAFLQKPFTPERLAQGVRSVLDRDKES
ncbi:MAG: PAS domain S-box protein [Deltaproteobacteria bacterium]|nr:PAS domain S-box protein [Deltaproteobacteria bacterium]